MPESSNNLRVFVVDDEFLARERIKRLLEDSPYDLCGEAENGETAIDKISKEKPDLVILDIRMPGIDGLEVASHLSNLNPVPTIIFCTAYDEYAIEAFKYQAAAYLLKPVRKEQLLESLDNAVKLTQAQIKSLEQSLNKEERCFVAQTWQGLERIEVTKIYYFQADHKYVTIFHEEGETVTDHTLKDIETELEDLVFRSHRNTIVMKEKIKAILKDKDSHSVFELTNGAKVPISRRLTTQAKQLI